MCCFAKLSRSCKVDSLLPNHDSLAEPVYFQTAQHRESYSGPRSGPVVNNLTNAMNPLYQCESVDNVEIQMQEPSSWSWGADDSGGGAVGGPQRRTAAWKVHFKFLATPTSKYYLAPGAERQESISMEIPISFPIVMAVVGSDIPC